MLGKLFGSKSRVRLLKLFLLHPEDKYYIRQISRDLKLQLNSVRRELENLEKFGLLTSNPDETADESSINEDDIQYITSATKNAKKTAKKSAKVDSASKVDKKYYRVNQDFILYKEIKALIMKSQLMYEKDFVEKVLATGKPKLMIFCGFFVNEDDGPVDIFLAGKMNKTKVKKLISDLEMELGREINYTIMDIEEFKYRRDITDVFIYQILEGKKILVIDEIGVGDMGIL